MYETSENEYKDFFELDTVAAVRPKGYLIRLEVFVLAPRDFHVILSPTKTPNLSLDLVYEIVIGGDNNQRTTIRKRRRNYELIERITPNVLSIDEPHKINIDVTTCKL